MARIHLPTPLLAVLLLCLLPLATAHIIHVGASSKECFFEDLNVNDKVRARQRLPYSTVDLCKPAYR
jgi:hypothetical protein